MPSPCPLALLLLLLHLPGPWGPGPRGPAPAPLCFTLQQALCHGGEAKLWALLHEGDLLLPSCAVRELVQGFPNTIVCSSCFKQ